MARILWSFTAQRGCLEPALPLIDALLARGHTIIGTTLAPEPPALPWPIEVTFQRVVPPPPQPIFAAQPGGGIGQALGARIGQAAWHRDEVRALIAEHSIDVVL